MLFVSQAVRDAACSSLPLLPRKLCDRPVKAQCGLAFHQNRDTRASAQCLPCFYGFHELLLNLFFSHVLYLHGQAVRILYTRANALGQDCFSFNIEVLLCYIEILVRLSKKLLFSPDIMELEVWTTFGTGTSCESCPKWLSALFLKHAYTNAACRRWAASPARRFYASRGCEA